MNERVGPGASVAAIVSAVKSGTSTAAAIAEAAIVRAERVQAELNCFAEIDADGLRAAAASLDRRRASGETLGPLAGVPVAIKDCTPVAGLGLRSGSYAFEHRRADHDAIVVRRFRAADAMILGKTTLSEFASSSFCDSPLHGITRNPWNTDRTPGGSSGGSAVAVATGCVAVAQGTDMGGSIRIPAAFTGLVGLKPAKGRIPLDDQPSFVDDIQHHGVLTRTIEDLRLVLPPLFGSSDTDPSTYIPDLSFLDEIGDVAGLRIAVTGDLGFFAVDAKVLDRLDRTVEVLEAAGAVVTPIDLAWDREISDGWVRHWHVYLAAFFGDDLDRIGTRADPRLVDAVRKGRSYDAVTIKRLDLMRARQWAALAGVFRDHDALLSPTMTRTAVDVSEDDARYHTPTDDGRKRGLDMTSLFNWAPQCPALSVPAGLSSDGLPIGMHIAAPPNREDIVLRVGATIERAFPHIWPPGWAP